MTPITSERRVFWGLLAILTVALGLRIWGCFGQGLPYSHYPDERSNVEQSLRYGAIRSLDPGGWFNKPAMGYYLLTAEYGAYYGVGRVLGLWQTPDEFGLTYVTNPKPFFVIGRLTATLFGVATVFLCFLVGRRIGGNGVGLLSAGALAVTLGHVASGQQVKMDVPSAFWSTWALLALLAVINRGRWRDYLAVGVLAGLGAATKYYPVVILLGPLPLAHLLRSPEARAVAPRVVLSPRFWAAIPAFVAAFFVGSPYNILDGWWKDKFVSLAQWAAGRVGLGQAFGTTKGFLISEEDSLWLCLSRIGEVLFSFEGCGPLIACLALLFVPIAVARRRRQEILLVGTVVIIWAFIGIANSQLSQARHLCLLYPCVAVMAGLGGWHGASWVIRRLPPSRLEWSAVGIVLLLLFLPVEVPHATVIRHNVYWTSEHPRNWALAWIEERVPKDSVIVNTADFPLVNNRARCAWTLDFLGGNGRGEAYEGIANDSRNYEVLWKLYSMAPDRYDGPTYDVLVFLYDWQGEKLRMRHRLGDGYNPIWPRSPWGLQLHQVLKSWDRTVMGPLTPEAVEDQVCRMVAAASMEEETAALMASSATSDGPMTKAQAQARAGDILRDRWAAWGGEWPSRLPSPVELWRNPTPCSRPWLTRDAGGNYRPVQYLVSARITYDNYKIAKKLYNFPDWARFYEDLERDYDHYEFGAGDPDITRTIRVYDLTERKPGRGRCKQVR
jgi:hypothetical protein